MTRRYGRALSHQRLHGQVPQKHYQTATLIAGIRRRGPSAPWIFEGAMNQQYQQIGNAVPTYLGRAIGQTFLPLLKGETATDFARPPRLEQLLEVASARLRRAACNKRGKDRTLDLFGQLA